MPAGHTHQHVLLASAARTTAQTPEGPTNGDGSYLDMIIDVTAGTAGFSITPTIQGLDPASGKWYTLLAGAAIGATGTTVLRVGPALTAAANTVAAFILPKTWRLSMAVADTKSVTYSVGANVN